MREVRTKNILLDDWPDLPQQEVLGMEVGVVDEEGDVVEVDADWVVGVALQTLPLALGRGGGVGTVDNEDGEVGGWR